MSYKKFRVDLFVWVVVFVFASAPTNAQISMDTSGSGGGSIILGYDSRTCDGASEGSIRYNSASKKVELCDGSQWALPSGGCAAPPTCPNVGDVCADGSLLAGFMIYSGSACEPLFVTATNPSSARQWKTTTGSNDISPDDFVDGQNNHANRGSGTFEAIERCEAISSHSKTDWYLPSHTELNLLWVNRDAIEANSSNFYDDLYWSSTEYDASDAWYLDFTTGYLSHTDKLTDNSVRCVRRN